MVELSEREIGAAVCAALAEDVGSGDATSMSCIEPEMQASGRMTSRSDLVVAGLGFAVEAFRRMSPGTQVEVLAREGDRLLAGSELLRVSGRARPILAAERVALNFTQRLCGIATLTRRFVDAVSGTDARILDTRKTTPGWRRFEKYAVECGGGENHRMGLFDRILIKDNHLAALRQNSSNPIARAISSARKFYPSLLIEVEVDDLSQLEHALDAGADWVLLDNMTPGQLRAAVTLVKGRIRTEASGGISLANVRAVAESGVDYISVGALTHSAPAADIGLDFA